MNELKLCFWVIIAMFAFGAVATIFTMWIFALRSKDRFLSLKEKRIKYCGEWPPPPLEES